MLNSATARGAALASVCLVILGTMPVVSNSRPDGFPALEFAFFLSVWQAFFAFPLFARQSLKDRKARASASVIAHPTGSSRLRVTVFALLTGTIFGLSTWFYVLSVREAGAANASIAIQAYPVFAILLEAILFGKRKSGLELLLTGIMVVTLYWLGTGGTWAMEGLSVWFLLALSVPLLWSIAHVIIREELARTQLTPEKVTFLRVLVSALFLGGVLLVSGPEEGFSRLLTPEFQVFAMLMGLVYWLELMFWFHSVRFIEVSLASAITTPWPALTMVLAALFLGENISPIQIPAFLLVVACVYGLTLAGLKREKRLARLAVAEAR